MNTNKERANVRKSARSGLARKLALMCGPALLGMVFLFVVAFITSSGQKRSVDDLYEQRFANFKESAFLESECASVHANLYKTLAWANAGYDAKQIQDLTKEQLRRLTLLQQRAAASASVSTLNPAEDKSFKQAANLLVAYAKAAADVIDVASTDTAYAAILMATADDRFTELNKVLSDLAELERSLGAESYTFASKSYNSGMATFIAVSLATLIASVLVIYVVARTLIRQVAAAQ